MDRLSTLLPKTLRKKGLADEAAAAQVTYAAREWLKDYAPDIALQCTVLKLERKELMIETDHSAAAQELHGYTHALREHLNALYPSTVDGVRIVRKND